MLVFTYYIHTSTCYMSLIVTCFHLFMCFIYFPPLPVILSRMYLIDGCTILCPYLPYFLKWFPISQYYVTSNCLSELCVSIPFLCYVVRSSVYGCYCYCNRVCVCVCMRAHIGGIGLRATRDLVLICGPSCVLQWKRWIMVILGFIFCFSVELWDCDDMIFWCPLSFTLLFTLLCS